ncbi:MAG: hypothetical protein BIFFINMI_00465 [Phycisphaerae bacterium]|nr:hypothetical protein [Phycisphaerae bacterium]
MGFLHPILLAGLALGALPIIIHLLTRRRHKVVRWGAMKYLLEAIEETSKRVQIEDLILLAMRVLIICLLALAVARPKFNRQAAGPGPRLAVLLVDNSPSMQADRGGSTRWDQARAWARSLLNSLPAGSRVAVLPLCNPTDPAALRDPTAQVLLAADVVDELPASALSADPVSAIRAASEIVGGSDLPNRSVYVLSDFQATDWRDSGNRLADAVRALLAQQNTTLTAVACGEQDRTPSNVAVTRLDRTWRVIKVGRDIQLNGELQRFAAADGDMDVATTIQIDRQKADARSAGVQASEPRRLDYYARFDAPGDHEVTLQSASDISPADNVRYLAVEAREEVRVLIVDGDRHLDAPVQSESFYLRYALAFGQSDAVPISVDIIDGEDIRNARLDRYDVVMLANVSQVPPAAAGELVQWVRAGHAAVIFLGDLVDTQSYNSGFLADAKGGFLRAHLGAPIDAPRDRQTGAVGLFNLAVASFAGPIMTFFSGDDLADLDKAGFSRALEIDLAGNTAADNVRVDAALSNGVPLLVTRELGEGRFALLNTTADVAWGNLAINPGFTPMMQRLLVWLLAPTATSTNLTPSQTWELSLPLETMDTPVTLKRPDGRTVVLEPVVDAARQRAVRTYSDTTLAGFYRVTWDVGDQQQSRLFSVNVSSREGDLAAIDAGYLRELAGPASPDIVWETLQTPADRLVGARAGGRELWLWVLGAALGLLVAEQYLGRRFSGGTR